MLEEHLRWDLEEGPTNQGEGMIFTPKLKKGKHGAFKEMEYYKETSEQQ